MKSKIFRFLTCIALMSMFVAPVSAQPLRAGLNRDLAPPVSPDGQVEFQQVDAVPVNNPTARGVVSREIKGATEPAIYLIRLADAPLASYRGGVAGLSATSPIVTGARKLDPNSPTSLAYTAYLASKRASFISKMENAFGRPIEVVHEYFAANNGLAAWLKPDEAATVAKMPGVTFVQREIEHELHTDYGPAWIGAPGIWDGTTTGGLPGTMGEGIIVGVIDTGINPLNPSFADVGGDGYDHTNPWGAGNYVGVCDPGDPSYDPAFTCNDKLIGAWGYPGNGDDPTDYNGHGSHTSSTAAGNVITATFVAPTMVYAPRISGVAPHANIVAYGSCCGSADLTASIDQIVLDGVDVVNYSIGSPAASDLWNDFDSVGYLNAREAGIFVATSAGNDGPGPATVGSPADAPWLTTSGSQTHNRAFPATLGSMSGGDTAPPPDLTGKGMNVGYGPASMVYAGNYTSTLTTTPNLCGVGAIGDFVSPWDPGTFSGEIVVCDRGTFGRVEKGANVLAAGAGGYVLANAAGNGEGTVGDPHELPSVHLGYTDGQTLLAWLTSGTGHMATIVAGTPFISDSNADIMAGFSSRGQNRALPGIIKPDVTAPGVDILAAYGIGGAVEWGMISGTSMASPHTAGAAALLMALHPSWTPAQIQSALMSTAYTGITKEDVVTPADPFDMGSGKVDLSMAGEAGMLLDETIANFWNADPDLGGDPEALNLASLGNGQCLIECSWTRVVSNSAGVDVQWTAYVDAAVGMTLTVDPPVLDLLAGDSGMFTVTADVSGLPNDQWVFGEVGFTPDEAVPAVHFPVAVLPTAGVLPYSVDIETRRNAGSQKVMGLQTIEITDLTVELFGLVQQSVDDFTVFEVPNPGFPQIFFQPGVNETEINVGAGSARLVVEVMETTSPDVDMMVIYDSNDNGVPELVDLDGNECQSAAGGSMESCDISNPVDGRWFALVANFEESGAPPDPVTLYYAVVPSTGNGNWAIDGPAAVAESVPYTLTISWDTPTMMAGDRWYGAFSLGSDPGNPGNIATIPVNITRHGDDVVKEVSDTFVDENQTLTYTITVETNVTPYDLAYILTDTIPAGLTYVPASASATGGTVDVVGNVLTWNGDMTVPIMNYAVSTNVTDPYCDTPFGGYVDLELFGIYPASGISGDTIWFIAFTGQNPIQFYGIDNSGINFTDDGFAFFDSTPGAAPWTNTPLPDPADPNDMMSIFWTDMEVVYDGTPGSVRGVTLASAGPEISIIEFDDMEPWPAGGSGNRFDFEVVTISTIDNSLGAYEIMFAYDNISGTVGSATVGLENLAGDLAANFLFGDPTGVIVDDLIICYDFTQFGDPVIINYQVTVDPGSAGQTLTNEVLHQTDNPGSLEATTSVDVEAYLELDATFTSNAREDGIIQEKNEDSGRGGRIYPRHTYLRAGDNSSDEQYVSVLSFDTRSLPDNAVILEATLELNQKRSSGDPYNDLGSLWVDVADRYFGRHRLLRRHDFQAPAGVYGEDSGFEILSTTRGVWVVTDIPGAVFNSINLTGRTQFRLRFDMGDDDDGSFDYIDFTSGNAVNEALWPQLNITYYVP